MHILGGLYIQGGDWFENLELGGLYPFWGLLKGVIYTICDSNAVVCGGVLYKWPGQFVNGSKIGSNKD